MMLSELEPRLTVRERRGPADAHLSNATGDSREVGQGTLFAAIPGTRVDGHDYIVQALAAGASAVVLRDWPDEPWSAPVPALQVDDPRRALGLIAAGLHGDPSRDLLVVGVTGTNGKTSTVAIIEALLAAGGLRPGVIGTTGIHWQGRDGREQRDATHTTPDGPALQALLARMHAAGVQAVAMELSSHALDQGRAAGLHLDVAAWSNVSRDHLDYHLTMSAYEAAKALLFTELLPASGKERRVAVVNIDDPAVAAHAADWPDCLRVSCDPSSDADIAPVSPPVFSLDGIACRVRTPQGEVDLASSLLGGHNLANLLLAGGIALAAGLAPEAVRSGWKAAPAARGRMERVQRDDGRGPLVVVDYAHSPDALATVLASLRPFVPGRLVTVFGCGGDRDHGKRPLMAAAGWAGSDAIVMTSANPRSEDPESILDAMEPGLPGELTPATALADFDTTPATRIADRRDAIRAAIAAAKPGDLVLVAGKGHEMTQETNGRKVQFDDREEARRALAEFHAPANEPPAGFSKHGRTVNPFPIRSDEER